MVVAELGESRARGLRALRLGQGLSLRSPLTTFHESVLPDECLEVMRDEQLEQNSRLFDPIRGATSAPHGRPRFARTSH